MFLMASQDALFAVPGTLASESGKLFQKMFLSMGSYWKLLTEGHQPQIQPADQNAPSIKLSLLPWDFKTPEDIARLPQTWGSIRTEKREEKEEANIETTIL